MVYLLAIVPVFLIELSIVADILCDIQAINSLKGPDLNQITTGDDAIILQCTAYNYDSTFRVFLRCTIDDMNVSQDQCYADCVAVTYENILQNCTKEIVSDGSIVFSYSFLKSFMPSGSYFCSYRGKDSLKFKHIKELKPNFTVTTIPGLPRHSNGPSRFEYMTILLILLSVSLSLNLIFLVRCLVDRNSNTKVNKHRPLSSKCSLTTCLCIDNYETSRHNDPKPGEDFYDNIRDIVHGSDTSRSKSSSGIDLQNLMPSSMSSHFTRSATFPVKQAILLQNPSMTSKSTQPYVMSYVIENSDQCIMEPGLNRRLSAQVTYDGVPLESSMRQFASTGSLVHRPKRLISSHTKASPLPEETQSTFNPHVMNQTDEGVGSTANDISSTYDINSSQGTCISGKESDSFKDPVRSAKLEMSREMMAKADTLLREAHNLLKNS